MRSRIEPMKKVTKTLLGHRELILNYFRAKKQFQRRHRGLEQQGQTDNEKSLWIPNFPRYRTRSVSRTGKATGAKRCPQILLTNQFIVGAYMAVLTWWLDKGAKLPPAKIDAMFRRLAGKGIESSYSCSAQG